MKWLLIFLVTAFGSFVALSETMRQSFPFVSFFFWKTAPEKMHWVSGACLQQFGFKAEDVVQLDCFGDACAALVGSGADAFPDEERVLEFFGVCGVLAEAASEDALQ